MPDDCGKNDMPAEILANSPTPLTLQYARRTLRMHSATEAELETIASLGNSVHLAFFGISFGAVIAFSIVLSTITISDPIPHATFMGMDWLSVILTFYFGVRAAVDYRSSRRKLKEIKSST
jgi:hypothetical protein